MKIGYQGFTFSIPMMGIIQIEEFVLRAELNDHAHVYFKLLVGSDSFCTSSARWGRDSDRRSGKNAVSGEGSHRICKKGKRALCGHNRGCFLYL